MAHLMGDLMPVQKVTIVGRGDSLGLAYYLPTEDRYPHTKEELVDVMKVALAGRAAEQIVFGRVTNGAANDLEKVTEIARRMVFEFGMSEIAPSRTMRADNYALSEETKRMRDNEQARFTDHAFEEAQRLLTKHRRPLDRLASALLEKETIDGAELKVLLAEVEPESRAAETVGTIRVLGARPRNSGSRPAPYASRARLRLPVTWRESASRRSSHWPADAVDPSGRVARAERDRARSGSPGRHGPRGRGRQPGVPRDASPPPGG